MPATKRPRKAYRPKLIRADNLTHVLDKFTPLSVDLPAVSTMRIKNHDAIENVRLGVATHQTVSTLVNALNIATALIMVKPTLGSDWMPEIRTALDALFALGNRNRLLFTGPELTAVNLAMDIHDKQLDECTVADIVEAANIVSMLYRSKQLRSYTN